LTSRVGVLGVVLGLCSCRGLVCTTDVIAQATSPDAVYSCVVVEQNCGATAPFTRRVSLHRLGLMGWIRPDAEIAVFRGLPEIQMEWQGDASLLLSFTPTSKFDQILSHDTAFGPIQIELRDNSPAG
jgi:hypothetical protein